MEHFDMQSLRSTNHTYDFQRKRGKGRTLGKITATIKPSSTEILIPVDNKEVNKQTPE